PLLWLAPAGRGILQGSFFRGAGSGRPSPVGTRPPRTPEVAPMPSPLAAPLLTALALLVGGPAAAPAEVRDDEKLLREAGLPTACPTAPPRRCSPTCPSPTGTASASSCSGRWRRWGSRAPARTPCRCPPSSRPPPTRSRPAGPRPPTSSATRPATARP